MELAWSYCLLLRRALQLPALLCCEAMAWAVTFIAFPLRMLAAVDRERKLVRLVAEMQARMEDLAWRNAALQDTLRAALREQDALEAILDEVEEQHEDALARIHALDAQLKALRQEQDNTNNMRRLDDEHKGKSKCDRPAPGPPAAAREEEAAAAARRAAADPASVLALTTEPPAAEAPKADEAAAVARRRSLFSLGMSVAVGTVAWSARAPCLPLLAGLFAVVAVSMRSVSRLLLLRRRSAGDAAVALLGLNWFLLGLLTSPMLPAVVPSAGHALAPALTWLAATAPL